MPRELIKDLESSSNGSIIGCQGGLSCRRRRRRRRRRQSEIPNLRREVHIKMDLRLRRNKSISVGKINKQTRQTKWVLVAEARKAAAKACNLGWMLTIWVALGQLWQVAATAR